MPLQMFCELPLYSQVFFKSIREADDNFKENPECQWVKERVVELKPQTYVRLLSFIFLIVALQLFRGGIFVALKQFIVVILLQFSL